MIKDSDCSNLNVIKQNKDLDEITEKIETLNSKIKEHMPQMSKYNKVNIITKQNYVCKYCGMSYYHKNHKCKARNKECFNCKKVGHLARVCFTKSYRNVVKTKSFKSRQKPHKKKRENIYINLMTNIEGNNVNVDILGIKTKGLIDTGAAVSSNINYPTKTLNLYDGIAQIALISTRQNEAKTLKHIELPARKISIIPVKIPKQYIGKQIILEPSQSLQNKSIVGAACLVSSSTQQAVMQVINPNEDKVVLNRNKIVALISEIQPNSVQNWSDKTDKFQINNIEKGHKKQKQNLNIDLSEADLTNDQKEKLRKFVDKNRNVFATDLSEIGMTDVHFHEIDTGNNPPVSLPPHRAAPNIRTEIERQVEEMLKYKIIEPSNSIWHSPVCLTRRKDNSWRFCVDYRRVNAFTTPMHATLGNMHDVFDTMGEMQPQIFSSIDLSSSFWQVPLHPNSKQKAAFVTHSGIYEWNRMPYGLRNSSIAFSQVMSQILRGLHWNKTFEEHLLHLEEVFARLRKANFTLKPQKCHFAVKKVNYLGHIISKDGVKVDDSKITIVKNYPRPKNQTEVRQFLGLCNYYRRFVKDYAKITVPLNNLLQKTKNMFGLINVKLHLKILNKL
ncbi:unnamed protein product [Mytilus edulis]|uniref:Uncharacterized protein n=1 Tax=Mytilus edulis TaxID=6550 RepID=A0A8S3QT47_MYTED|nr:unnamed protein product [Mytilus edulis]